MRAFWFVALCALAVSACSHRCVPHDLVKQKYLDPADTAQEHRLFDPAPSRGLVGAVQRLGAAGAPPNGKPYHVLALSGGGLFAAFSAGVLKGWTESGTRPEFDIVTGVSSGSLMATFAFLGPEYDGMIQERLVGLDPRRALRMLPVHLMPFYGSVFSPRPLTDGINETVTAEVLCKVAQAHAAGRRLYIATTNLDTRRLVLWDMGAIASRGPEALDLYKGIILASSAVPGAYPPFILPVEVNGVEYQEMHLDGAVSDTVVFRPNLLSDLNRARGSESTWAPPGSRLYALNNDKFYPEPKCVKLLLSAIGATVEGLYSNKCRDGLARIYLNCLQTGIDFRVTGIPQGFPVAGVSTKLSPEEQRKLFELGRCVGQQNGDGDGWRSEPPGLEPGEQTIPRTGTKFVTEGPCLKACPPAPAP